VRFHDGSALDAQAVVWNLDKLFNESAPQFDPRQSGQIRGRLPVIDGYAALDPATVSITTRKVDAFLPFEISYLLFSSPARWEECGRDWGEVAKRPPGTGPFKADRIVPRQRRNWCATRLLGPEPHPEGGPLGAAACAGRGGTQHGADVGATRLGGGAGTRYARTNAGRRVPGRHQCLPAYLAL
jgi:hypothetical protein